MSEEDPKFDAVWNRFVAFHDYWKGEYSSKAMFRFMVNAIRLGQVAAWREAADTCFESFDVRPMGNEGIRVFGKTCEEIANRLRAKADAIEGEIK